MNTEVMFSHKKNNWATPQHFFDKLNEEFGFTLDPCADDQNHKTGSQNHSKRNDQFDHQLFLLHLLLTALGGTSLTVSPQFFRIKAHVCAPLALFLNVYFTIFPHVIQEGKL